MTTHFQTMVGEVSQIIKVNPDALIELGHKIKELSMNQAMPGDSILVAFTDRITFVYTPEKEFTKPVHTYGQVEVKTPITDGIIENGGLGW